MNQPTVVWNRGNPPNSIPVLLHVFCGDEDWFEVAWFNGISWFGNHGMLLLKEKSVMTIHWCELQCPPEYP